VAAATAIGKLIHPLVDSESGEQQRHLARDRDAHTLRHPQQVDAEHAEPLDYSGHEQCDCNPSGRRIDRVDELAMM
jgi:hypothetical protein